MTCRGDHVAVYRQSAPYLIKKGIDYVEICPSHPHFMEHIVPTVGYITHPVLETPDGNIIADSMEIMEFLEPEISRSPHAA